MSKSSHSKIKKFFKRITGNFYKIRRFFTHITDHWHALLGFAASIHVILPPYGWIGSLIILAAFIIYESVQKEDPVTSTQDIVEFIVGWLFGTIAWRLQ